MNTRNLPKWLQVNPEHERRYEERKAERIRLEPFMPSRAQRRLIEFLHTATFSGLVLILFLVAGILVTRDDSLLLINIAVGLVSVGGIIVSLLWAVMWEFYQDHVLDIARAKERELQK